MNLESLAAVLKGARLIGDPVVEISGVHYDSRAIEPGDLFVAIPGDSRDGHDYIKQAVKNGAAAVLVTDINAVPSGVHALVVKSPRLALAEVATLVNGTPTADLVVCGITGTNGKTTTSYLIDSILRSAGKTTGVVGTIEYRIAADVEQAKLTTPEAPDLQALFRRMVDADVSHTVMEVSSHAVAQQRIDGIQFNVGVFTNLTRDHLDYHQNLEEYSRVKASFFHDYLRRFDAPAVLNLSDKVGREIATQFKGQVISYGLDPEFVPHIFPKQLESSTDGLLMLLQTPEGELPINSKLVGSFNAMNIMAAVGAALAMDIPLEAIKQGIERQELVPGRVESVPNDLGITAVVDYAHTPDALQRVLETMRELTEKRLICVFGCGGDRDPGKRPVMGRVAATCADLAIVTSDNPRTEKPQRIIDDILVGVIETGAPRRSVAGARDSDGYVVEADRRNAIWMAVGLANPGDIVVIAGKGHEDYQILGREYFHFDDCEEAAHAMDEKYHCIEEAKAKQNLV